jgi:hypothetical protein
VFSPLCHVLLLLIKKISEQPCSNGEPIRHTVLWKVIRTAHKPSQVPHGSRPHGHDRSLTLRVNDPGCWSFSISLRILNTVPFYCFHDRYHRIRPASKNQNRKVFFFVDFFPISCSLVTLTPTVSHRESDYSLKEPNPDPEDQHNEKMIIFHF